MTLVHFKMIKCTWTSHHTGLLILQHMAGDGSQQNVVCFNIKDNIFDIVGFPRNHHGCCWALLVINILLSVVSVIDIGDKWGYFNAWIFKSFCLRAFGNVLLLHLFSHYSNSDEVFANYHSSNPRKNGSIRTIMMKKLGLEIHNSNCH